MPQANSEELYTECLRDYELRTNDDNDIMLVLPGYFKGRPLVSELYYNGKENAIFVRNPYQRVVCDAINPFIRKLLSTKDRILIYEADMEREYEASVIRADVDTAADKAVRFHDYSFRYHPFPLTDGTFNVNDAMCDMCDRPVKIYYKGRTYPDNKQMVICPKCIAEYPINRGVSLFPDADERCIGRDGWEEVFGATPPYLTGGEPAGLWGVHCDHLSVFLGKLEYEDITPDLWNRIIETWDHEMNEYKDLDPWKILTDLDHETKSAYLFKCSECGKLLCIFYEN